MKTKGVPSLLLALPFIVLSTAACDSTTNLEEVSLVGIWDGVGELQTTDAGRGLTLFIESDGGGTVSGSWTRTQDVLHQGNIVGSATESGGIALTLQFFPGVDPTFEGDLTDQHRMSGEMNVTELEGSAVFRRRSVSP